MKILFLLLSILFVFQSCTDVFEHKEYLITEDIYALHSAGVDGFSMSKKISASGYRLLIQECIVSASFNKNLNCIIAKRIASLSAKDTIYLKYSLENGHLDTITSIQFYNIKSRDGFNPDVILLK